MSGAHILAVGAVSPFGIGEDAFYLGRLHEPARVVIAPDDELARSGVARASSARVPLASDGDRDRAAVLLHCALEQCARELDGLSPDWRTRRVGLAVGTSAGAMATTEKCLAALARGGALSRDVARGTPYFAPLEQATADLRLQFFPRAVVLGACASSTLAIGLAMRWLDLGRCDLVLAGGFDALSTFVAAGFDALRATTATVPRPFRLGRDGLALGEGAAILALAKTPTAGESHRRSSYLAGFGASTDAVHLTAPDPTGRGLARAAMRALADAAMRGTEVGLVSAHATATPFNDPAEAKALTQALGESTERVVHPMKAQIGHTLGAAGVLESLGAFDALARGIGPAAAGAGDLDPECAVTLLEKNERRRSNVALKLSSAFGGSNAALVLTSRPVPASRREPRPVYLCGYHAIAAPLEAGALADFLRGRHPHLHRLDPLAKLVLSAACAVGRTSGVELAQGAGVIVGHSLATLEANDQFAQKLRELGPRFVDPRRFPMTSPNACAGECAIGLRLTGPSFAVGGSLHGGLEALSVAHDLVAAGDAPMMLVVAADLGGGVSSSLLSRAGAGPIAEGACAAILSAEPGPRAPGEALAGEIPLTLATGQDWIWIGPYGHRELRTYLAEFASRA